MTQSDRPQEYPTSYALHDPRTRHSQHSAAGYHVPGAYRNLDEVQDSAPVQHVDEPHVCQSRGLEDARAGDHSAQEHRVTRTTSPDGGPAPEDPQEKPESSREGYEASRWTTQLYTLSYLIFFSILGTLARLGLRVLTKYPGAPVFPSVWFNFGGCVAMGFMSEDRMLFRSEWGMSTDEREIQKTENAERGAEDAPAADPVAAKKARNALQKTIPLYIGVTTGFCGSFTSFSSFIRDAFLALSNDLPHPDATPTVPRNGGYSFMALTAVVIITITASLSGLYAGAHLAIALEPVALSLPHRFLHKFADRLAVVLGFGCWIGAVLLAALPPADYYRGDAAFALVFAPLGALARFYVSLALNGRKPAFPLGTFAVNVFGTAVVAMAWDLQRVPLGGVVGCQVLQGVEDGFCGCLTTVSTWASELVALRRTHAWIYGSASVLVSLGVMVIIMGGLRWTDGWAVLQCAK